MQLTRTLRFAGLTVAVLLAVAAPLTGQGAAKPAPADSAKADSAAGPGGAPVTFDGDTIFVLHGNLGPFTAAARASAVNTRLRNLARAAGERADTIVVADREGDSELLVGGNVLMSVLDADTTGNGTRQARARRHRYADLFEAMLEAAKHATTPAALGIDALLAILATAVLAALLALLRAVFPRVHAAADSVRRMQVPSGRWQALRLVPPAKIADAAARCRSPLRVLLTVLLFYVYIPLVLSLFPWTADFSRRLTGYAITPFAVAWSAFVAYVPNVFYIAVIVADHAVPAEGHPRCSSTRSATGRSCSGASMPDWAKPTYDIARVLVFAFAAVVVFPYLPGAQSDAFKGVSLFLGVLFSLGSSSAVGNVVAGVLLTYTRAFQIGDRAQIGETVGDITEKTLLVTRLRTIKNVEVTIPNAARCSTRRS